MKVPDEILIQKTLDGDKSSFGILVDRYKRSVFQHVIKTTRDFHDAQDITQDVFVEAYFKLKNLREPVKFGRWLRGITQNLCRRWMRKKQMLSDLEIPLDNLQTEVINQWLGEQENAESWEFGTNIAAKLSDEQKSLLKLFYLDNRSCREIAQQMGATEVAIRQRLSRIRQQLKNDLLEGEKDTNGMIAISAICAFLLGGALSVSGGTQKYDFDDGNLDSWTMFGGLWEVKNGVLVCKNNNDFASLVTGESTWKNYTVAFDAKVKSHQGQYAICGSIRDDVAGSLAYYCIVNMPPNWGDTIQASVYVDPNKFGEIIIRNFPTKVDKWYNFRVTLDGDKFNFFLDNNIVISADWSNQPLPKSGKISLWNRWPSEIHYDNVVITGDDVPNSGFSIESKGKLTTAWGHIKQAD